MISVLFSNMTESVHWLTLKRLKELHEHEVLNKTTGDVVRLMSHSGSERVLTSSYTESSGVHQFDERSYGDIQ